MRVLVAEDVRRLADDIAEGLRDQGIAADVAYDGTDAAAKLDLNPYDVLVLDRDLPGIHGDTLCRTTAAAGNPVMILMLTAAGAPWRPGHRPVSGRGRLPAQALPLPRTRAAHPRPGPPQARRPAPHPARSRDRTRPAPPHRHPPRPPARHLGQGIRRPRNSSSKRPPPPSAPKASSLRPGTRTPTRSPRPSRSPSAGSAANSANPRPSRPSPASATASQIPASRPDPIGAQTNQFWAVPATHRQSGTDAPNGGSARPQTTVGRAAQSTHIGDHQRAGEGGRTAADPGGCHQHVFQPRYPAFSGVRHGSRSATMRSAGTVVSGAGRR